MTISGYALVVIVLSAVVTWLPRIAPFILTKYKSLPDVVIRFLNYLPVSIIYALTLSSILDEKVGQLSHIKWLELLAVLPTLWVSIRYKNILLSVIVGVIAMAILRFIAL